MRRFASIYIHIAHFRRHADITLQDVPNREYTLRVFVENVEREIQRKDNYTWTLAQRPYVRYFANTCTYRWVFVCRDVSPTSQVRAEARMKSGHSVWTKYREASEIIDLHGVFNDYWTSNDHEFTVLSQSLSPRSPRISNWEGQRVLSLESIMGLCNYGSLRIMPFVLIIFAMSHPPS